MYATRVTPPAPDVQDRTRRRRRRRLALLAVLAPATAAALLAVAPSYAGPTALEQQVRERLPALQEFVERERGLAFRRPVEVELLDDAAFLDAYGHGEHEPSSSDRSATLRGLGVIGTDEDLEELTDELLEDGLSGFFDPVDDRLVVRGTRLDAVAEVVLVHELAHALQHQHFDLAAHTPREGDDERALAYSAVVEGDAQRVEHAWWAALPASAQAEVDEPGGYPWVVGDAVADEIDFPYRAGHLLVEDLLRSGGQAALDRAFLAPPTTSEQVLHPGSDGPRSVLAPRGLPPGDVVDRGVLGELGLALLLERDPVVAGPQTGWGGDRYVTVELADGSGTCTFAEVVMDTPAQRDRLLRALQRWADVQEDAGVEPRDGDGLALRTCRS